MKKLIAIILMMSMMFTITPVNIQAATDSSSDWNSIQFNTGRVYDGKAIRVSFNTNVQGWHYSSTKPMQGNWVFTFSSSKKNVSITDMQMGQIMVGTLEAEKLSQPQTVETPLPAEVIDYINKGGSWDNIRIEFDTKMINSDYYKDQNNEDLIQELIPNQIFKDGEVKYKIQGNKIAVTFSPIFKVSENAIYEKTRENKMFISIPQGLSIDQDAYGYTGYALYDKKGNKLGAAYDKNVKWLGYTEHKGLSDASYIAPSDIAGTSGDLKAGKAELFCKTDAGKVTTVNSTNVRVGAGTFIKGGAVGVGFYFPINATFTINDTKYAVASSGFLTDGSTATADFIDSDSILTGIIPEVKKAMTYLAKMDANLVTHINADKETMDHYYKSNTSWTPAQVNEYKNRAIELITKAFGTEDNKLLLDDYILLNTNNGAFGQYLVETGLFTEDDLAWYKANAERSTNIAILQYILDNGLWDKYGIGYGKYSSDVLYKGTDIPIKNEYYKMMGKSSLSPGTVIKNIIGIDEQFKDKLYEESFVPIAYMSMGINLKNVVNMPKSLMKQMVSEFTYDLLEEARKIDINSSNAQKDAIKNILYKWVGHSAIDTEYENILTTVIKDAIFEVVNDDTLAYGAYNKTLDTYKAIRVNEESAASLFTYLVQFIVLQDNGGYPVEKQFTNDAGQKISLKSVLNNSNISASSFEGLYGIENDTVLSKALKGVSYGKASIINSSSVESVTRIATAEAAVNSNAKVKENPDGTYNIDGTVGTSVVLFDKGVPVDLYIVGETENKETSVLGIREKYSCAVPNYVRELPLKTDVAINGENLQVVKAIIKPASIDIYSFISKVDSALKSGQKSVSTGVSNSAFITPQYEKSMNIKFSLTGEDTLAYEANSNNRPAILLYVEEAPEVIVDPTPPPTTSVSGDLILTQKRITKAYSLNNIGSGVKPFIFSYGSADRKIVVDPLYKYVVKASGLNALAIALPGAFSVKYSDNTKAGSAVWSGGSSSISPNMQFAVWRGKDLPTLASYKEQPNNPLVKDLGLPIGKTPQPLINTTGGYQDSISIMMRQSYDDDAKYETTFTDGDYPLTIKHLTSDKADYKATLGVQSFIGSPNIGASASGYSSSSFGIGGIPFSRAKGYAVPSGNLIKFYPYVQMAYDLPGSSVSTPVNVLAAHESSIKPVDYVEVGWTNPTPAISLTLSSTQWSTHSRAVSKWGKNNVLPGGAIYRLDTKTNVSKVGVTTWQTYVHNNILAALTAGGTYFNLNSAVARDNDINNQVKASLNGLDIVQYVDRDPSKSNAFGGIKLNAAGGQDVYGIKTSPDPKYWLRRGTSGTSVYANEADLDIASESGKTRTYYKIASDVNGNVIISKCTDGANWFIIETLSKVQTTAANITKAEIKELDNRTKLVTNFLAAIDRNKGSDKTIGSYKISGDDKWYNEAWDGIIVMKTDTVYNVGLSKPVTRTAAIDPKLTPVKASTSDTFTKAYISQFRSNDKSVVHPGEVSGFVARFNGVNIVIPEMQNMYQSRKFYIPNATVMDLY